MSDSRVMLRHPIDTAYDLKNGTRGGILAASLLYFFAVCVFLIDTAFSAALFKSQLFTGYGTNPVLVVSALLIPGSLFILGNYFISSINDGEGRMRHVYIALAYALIPYILFTPWITLLTHALTLNEAFINSILRMMTTAYTMVLLFIAIQEIHRYTFWQTFRNILLTLCFVVLGLLAMMILYMVWSALLGFVGTIFEEVRLRG